MAASGRGAKDSDRPLASRALTRCLELVPRRTPPWACTLTWAWSLGVGVVGEGDVAVGEGPDRPLGGWYQSAERLEAACAHST